MRKAPRSIMPATFSDRSSSGEASSTRAPLWIAANGLRRSCPSTAMNWSRSSVRARSSLSASSLTRSRSCASRCSPIRLANNSNMPIVALVRTCAGLRIDRAQRAEEPAVGQADRCRDVALEAVELRRRVPAEGLVFGHVVDGHELAAVADLIADRRRHLQFPAGQQSELDVVLDGARDPSILGHAGHGREAHPGHLADHVQDGRNDIETRDDGEVFLQTTIDELCRLLAGASVHQSVVGHR